MNEEISNSLTDSSLTFVSTVCDAMRERLSASDFSLVYLVGGATSEVLRLRVSSADEAPLKLRGVDVDAQSPAYLCGRRLHGIERANNNRRLIRGEIGLKNVRNVGLCLANGIDDVGDGRWIGGVEIVLSYGVDGGLLPADGANCDHAVIDEFRGSFSGFAAAARILVFHVAVGHFLQWF